MAQSARMTEKLDRTLALRVTGADMSRLNDLAQRFPDFVTERALARVALRLGLKAIAEDPSLLLATPIPRRGGARRTKRKRSR